MSDAQNQPKPIPPASEIETYRPKPVLPAEPSQELLSVLAQALQAQINAGDYSSIDKIIELQAKSNENDQAFRNQEIQLKQQAIEQGYTITKMRETRLDNETKAKKNTNRLVMGAITLAFAGSLGYGFLHKDTSLADKIFTGAMGILGGAGGLVLSQKKDKE
jgi:hypothetical protein